MKLEKLVSLLLVLFLFGCNTDDVPSPQTEELQEPIAFQVVGVDGENVYLFTQEAGDGSGTQENLTTELGVLPSFLTLRQFNGTLAFYSFFQGSFSLAIRDLGTGGNQSFDQFFANAPSRSVVWGTNSESDVFFGFFTPGSPRSIGIQDVTFSGALNVDVIVDNAVRTLTQPLSFNNKAYFVYVTDEGENRLTFYDFEAKLAGPILSFGEVPITIFESESGNLAVIRNESDIELEIYDADDLTLLQNEPLNIQTGFSVGPLDGASFDGSTFYFPQAQVQPSIQPFAPAIFDLETQEKSVLDLFQILDDLQQELGAQPQIALQQYNNANAIFLVGYSVLGAQPSGGILQITSNGELLSNTRLPFFPTFIVDENKLVR